MNLRIPKLRSGRYFPPCVESRRTAEKVLAAVILETCVMGLSARSVDERYARDQQEPRAAALQRASSWFLAS